MFGSFSATSVLLNSPVKRSIVQELQTCYNGRTIDLQLIGSSFTMTTTLDPREVGCVIEQFYGKATVACLFLMFTH